MAEDKAFAVEAAAAAAGVDAFDAQIMTSYEARYGAMTEVETVATAAEAAKYLKTAAEAATSRALAGVNISEATVKAFKAQALEYRKTATQATVEEGAGAATTAYGLEAEIRSAEESTLQQMGEEESVAAPAVQMDEVVQTAVTVVERGGFRAGLEENMATTSSGAATQTIEIEKATASHKRQAGLGLPPSRFHVAAAREELVTHPVQVLDGQTFLYRQDEVGLPDLLSQLAGWSLNLGVAPVRDGGLPRAAEEFAVACGFSAAFGPPLIEVVSNVNSFTTPPHEASMWNSYWDREVAPFDAAERFLRLAKGCKGGAASKMREEFKVVLSRVLLMAYSSILLEYVLDSTYS